MVQTLFCALSAILYGTAVMIAYARGRLNRLMLHTLFAGLLGTMLFALTSIAAPLNPGLEVFKTPFAITAALTWLVNSTVIVCFEDLPPWP